MKKIDYVMRRHRNRGGG